MGKTILYPFSTDEDNRLSFQKTLKLAERITAKVVCFTAVNKKEDLDDVYLHLLALNGYYQTTSNNWQRPKIKIERNIKVGEMESHLLEYLNEAQFDILIKEPSLGKRKTAVLDNWIEEQSNETEVYCFCEDPRSQ